MGVHLAVQPPEVSSSHLALAPMSRSPHDERSARASCALKNVKAVAASKETKMEVLRMVFLGAVHMPRS
jgi:hypothetical protein